MMRWDEELEQEIVGRVAAEQEAERGYRRATRYAQASIAFAVVAVISAALAVWF